MLRSIYKFQAQKAIRRFPIVTLQTHDNKSTVAFWNYRKFTPLLYVYNLTINYSYRTSVVVRNLPRSWRRFITHHQRLVPVLLEQVEHIELIAAVIRQRVRPRIHATKHPHFMSIQGATVIRQRRWTSICLQPAHATEICSTCLQINITA